MSPASDLPVPRDSVAAVVVAHHPDPGFASRLARVATQVAAVIVVDNHSSPPVRDHLADAGVVHAELIENARNEGIGRALNHGVQRAAARGFRWVLTLDQDTAVDPRDRGIRPGNNWLVVASKV